MADERIAVRPATDGDLPAVSEIQAACPEAAHWAPGDYLAYDFVVAECQARIAGFAVARHVGEGESELLTIAVAPGFRRRGVGRSLLRDLLTRHSGDLLLEVRQSNLGAREFYQVIGFKEVGRRDQYYNDPPEAAVVMKFLSCYCHK